MHAIIAAVVAALLLILLFKVIRKQRLLGAALDASGIFNQIALALLLVGLVLIVIGWVGVAALAWAPWVVWAGVVVYLFSAVQRAVRRMS